MGLCSLCRGSEDDLRDREGYSCLMELSGSGSVFVDRDFALCQAVLNTPIAVDFVESTMF